VNRTVCFGLFIGDGLFATERKIGVIVGLNAIRVIHPHAGVRISTVRSQTTGNGVSRDLEG